MRDRPIPKPLMQKWLEVAPMPTTNIVVMKGAYVLLVKRKIQPEKDRWFTPGGILTKGKNAVFQALEILHDETGIEGHNLSLLLVDDEFYTDGYGTRDVHLITVVYKHEAESTHVSTNDDHSAIKWFPVTSLPQELHMSVRKWILEAIRRKTG